ncbi:MAG: hypothetical protein ABH826_03945 [Patescibacteria group bacterium]|nr:hypothetical protein [Patescibacteria group bacterium]
MKDSQNHLLICPKNDEESLMILKIAKKIKLPTIVSKQPHGAKLSREKNLLKQIKKTAPEAKKVFIVEIPGLKEEKTLGEAGFKVVIIDHHRYGELDRMKKKSSLEQFLTAFKITPKDLEKLGFDSTLVAGVAAMDRGFIWELKKQKLSTKDFKRVLEFYRELTLEVEGKRRLKEETAAKKAWDKREEKDGVIIVSSQDDTISLRDSISFLVAETYSKSMPVLIIQGKRRIYFQDTKRTTKLLKKFGGFTFGGDKCWGILKEDKDLPGIEEILAVIKK